MKLTDPNVATKPAIVTPVAIPVGENSASAGNLPPLRIPTPPVAAERFPLPDRVGEGLGGDDNTTGVAAAPASEGVYGRVPSEYRHPETALPEQVSQREIRNQYEQRFAGNIGPAANDASAPVLAGTKVVAGLDALARKGGKP